MQEFVEQGSIFTVVFDNEDLHGWCGMMRGLGPASRSPNRGNYPVLG
jgi:hypothetical protein